MARRLFSREGTVLGAIGLSIALGGCSANPHTVRGDQPTAAESPSQAGTQQQVAPPAEPEAPSASSDGASPTDGVSGTTGPTGEAGAPGVGSDGSAGPSGNTQTHGGGVGIGTPADSGVSGPSGSTTTVYIVGEPGTPGAAGCGITLYNQEFSAVSLSPDELQSVSSDLPYVSTQTVRRGRRVLQRGHSISVIPIGHAQTSVCGERVVTNSQVVFKVDAVLPNYQAFQQLTEAQLFISVSKTVRGRGEQNFMETEMLCLLGDVKKCSGFAINAPNWLQNRNPSFFGTEDPVVSEVFSRSLVNDSSRVRVSSCPRAQVYSIDDASIQLQEAFRGVDLSSALYSGVSDSTDAFVRKTLFFTVADDTYVKNAKLKIQLRYDSCRTNELTHASGSEE